MVEAGYLRNIIYCSQQGGLTRFCSSFQPVMLNQKDIYGYRCHLLILTLIMHSWLMITARKEGRLQEKAFLVLLLLIHQFISTSYEIVNGTGTFRIIVSAAHAD